MGRWAQRQRRGGGPGTRPPPTVTITSIEVFDNPTGAMVVTFSADVVDTDFAGSDFFNLDIGSAADAVLGGDPNQLIVSAVAWIGLINAGQQVQYTGSAPDVVTPQTVVIT